MQMQLPSDVQSEFLSISMHFPFSVWKAVGTAEIGTGDWAKQNNKAFTVTAQYELSEVTSPAAAFPKLPLPTQTRQLSSGNSTRKTHNHL